MESGLMDYYNNANFIESPTIIIDNYHKRSVQSAQLFKEDK